MSEVSLLFCRILNMRDLPNNGFFFIDFYCFYLLRITIRTVSMGFNEVEEMNNRFVPTQAGVVGGHGWQ